METWSRSQMFFKIGVLENIENFTQEKTCVGDSLS